jgi:hypothetical protein
VNPIPLTSPDGTAYAYACGVCHHVAQPVARTHQETGEQRPWLELVSDGAEWSLERATACCICRDCGARVGHADLYCTICEAARIERVKVVQAAHAERDQVRETQNAAKLARSPNKDAAWMLVVLMSDISEDCWCAGWLMGCEYSLWSIKENAEDRTWGMAWVSDDDCAKLRELSAQCGGWWIWDREAGGNVFLTLEEWEPLYATRMKELENG